MFLFCLTCIALYKLHKWLYYVWILSLAWKNYVLMAGFYYMTRALSELN